MLPIRDLRKNADVMLPKLCSENPSPLVICRYRTVPQTGLKLQSVRRTQTARNSGFRKTLSIAAAVSRKLSAFKASSRSLWVKRDAMAKANIHRVAHMAKARD